MGQTQLRSNAHRADLDTGVHSPAIERVTPMTDAPAPEPAHTPPPAHPHRRQLIKLVVLVAVIATPIVLIALGGESHKPRPLCDMLRDGWTADEIVDSDEWRDWPSSMSRMERSAAVLREADRNCPKLIGL